MTDTPPPLTPASPVRKTAARAAQVDDWDALTRGEDPTR